MRKRSTHELMMLMLCFAFCTCLCAIILVLCYRVMVDGNDDLSKAITNSLMTLGVALIVGIAGTIGINKIGLNLADQSSNTPPSQTTAIPPSGQE